MGNVLDCSADPLADIDRGEMDEAPVAAGGSCVLESGVLLSQSRLWQLQRQFYDDKGADCWSKGLVPNFVSTNAYIARAYASAFVSLLGDVFDAPGADRSQPLYVVEAGAGPGKFAYLFLQQVLELREFLPRLEGGALPFVYVLSDSSSAMADFWTAHPRLAPLMEEGLLDWAVADAEAATELRLQRAAVTLASTAHPLCLIANYTCDSVRQDAFRVSPSPGGASGGAVQRAHVSLVATGGPPPPGAEAGALLAGLKCAWTYEAAAADAPLYPSEPDIDAVARACCQCEGGDEVASVIFPLGGLRMLRSLSAIAGGRLVALVGDKGYLRPDEMQGDRDPHLAFHGSFSAMVNFDALRRFAELRGGDMLATPYAEGFKCALLSLGLPREALPQTRWAWQEQVRTLGPDGFATLQRASREDCPQPSLKHLLSLLRLSAGDADLFYKCKRQLLAHVVNTSLADTQKQDLLLDVAAVARSYFPMQSSRDVCFELGRILMALRQYPLAIEQFQDSLRFCGAHHVTWENIGICHYHQDAMRDALKCFDSALELNPEHQETRHWKTKAELRLDMGIVRAEDHPAAQG